MKTFTDLSSQNTKIKLIMYYVPVQLSQYTLNVLFGSFEDNLLKASLLR